MSAAEPSREDLVRENAELRRQTAELHQRHLSLERQYAGLEQEKTDLELIIEMSTEHSDYVEDDLLNRIESTLRESERRFRLISETIPVPITVSRASDHTIVYANEPAGRLFGIALPKLRRYRITDFYPPTVRRRLVRQLTMRVDVNNYDIQGLKFDGTIFYGILYARPLTFNGEACLLCAIHDITEWKHAEDEIRVLNEELEERVKRRTDELEHAHARIVKLEKEAVEVQMAGGFAHEMRNALVGAKLMLAGVVEDNETLCQKNVDILGRMYDAIAAYLPGSAQKGVLHDLEMVEQHEELLDNMLRMVNSSLVSALSVTTLILEYSRLGRATAGNDQVSLSAVINRVIQEHQAAFGEQGIGLHSTLQKTASLVGHESHFHSMINNIILNARDELLDMTDERQRLIDISLHQEHERVIVTITDTANGIPDDAVSKIFEPFFSTKPTTGTGLGLSFVAKLVPLYGGDIQVRSRMHEGTTFLLTFPLRDHGGMPQQQFTDRHVG